MLGLLLMPWTLCVTDGTPGTAGGPVPLFRWPQTDQS